MFSPKFLQAESEIKLMDLKAERDETLSDQTRHAEKDAALAMATEDDEESLEHFVRNILLPRHLKEMASLSERLQREMEAAKQQARAKVGEIADCCILLAQNRIGASRLA